LITTHPRVFPKITRQHPTEGIQYCNALGMPFFCLLTQFQYVREIPFAQNR
jgi:hypothetical protein